MQKMSSARTNQKVNKPLCGALESMLPPLKLSHTAQLMTTIFGPAGIVQ